MNLLPVFFILALSLVSISSGDFSSQDVDRQIEFSDFSSETAVPEQDNDKLDGQKWIKVLQSAIQTGIDAIPNRSKTKDSPASRKLRTGRKQKSMPDTREKYKVLSPKIQVDRNAAGKPQGDDTRTVLARNSEPFGNNITKALKKLLRTGRKQKSMLDTREKYKVLSPKMQVDRNAAGKPQRDDTRIVLAKYFEPFGNNITKALKKLLRSPYLKSQSPVQEIKSDREAYWENQLEVENERMDKDKNRISYPEYSFIDVMKLIKKHLSGIIDKDAFKRAIEYLYGTEDEIIGYIIDLIQNLHKKTKQEFLHLIDEILDDEEDSSAVTEIKTPNVETLDVQSTNRFPKFNFGKFLIEKYQNAAVLKNALRVSKKFRSPYQTTEKFKTPMPQNSANLVQDMDADRDAYFGNQLKVDNEKLDADRDHIFPLPGRVTFDLFELIKEYLARLINKEALKAKIEKLFGNENELAENIYSWITAETDDVRRGLLRLIDKIFDQEDRRSFLTKDNRSKVNDLNAQLEDTSNTKFFNLGKWFAEKSQNSTLNGNSKFENATRVAREFLQNTRENGKDMATKMKDIFHT